jgi:hypothetical protein
MPRRRRLSPGENYGSSGSGLDIGSLLMSIYGGVDVNAPDSSISSIEGPNQGTGEGTLSPATAAKQNSPVFKARTIFDRQRANALENQYKVQQLQNQNESAQRVNEEKAMIPVAVQKETLLGDLKNKQALALQEGQIPLALKLQEGINKLANAAYAENAGTDVLKTNNIIPTEQSRQQYINHANTEGIVAAVAKLLANTAQSNDEGLRAKLGQQITLGTSQPTIEEAIARSKFGAANAQSDLTNQPNLYQHKLTGLAQDESQKEAEIRNKNFIPIGKEGLFDVNSLRFTLNPQPEPNINMQTGGALSPESRIQKAPPAISPNLQKIVDPQTGQEYWVPKKNVGVGLNQLYNNR